MSKHTPGPWIAFDEGGVVGVTIPNKSDVAWIRHEWCGLQDTSRSHDEDIANAHLIAAAPDMYPITQVVAALYVADDARDDVPVFGTNGNYITVGDVRRARAAIRALIPSEDK